MKKYVRYIATLSLILVWAFISRAEEVLFSVEPGKIPYWEEGKVFSAWNPKGPETQTEGLKIYFFGEGDGCRVDIVNGLVEQRKPKKDEFSILKSLNYKLKDTIIFEPSNLVAECEKKIFKLREAK